MSVYKEEKTGTWRVLYRYADWTGEKKQTQKRGFKTKREAQAWEREQMNKVESSLDMTFESFVGRYREDKEGRIKENTWEMKNHIIETKLLPYFGKLKMDSITPQQIITWQNELLNYKDDKGKAYSPVYLKTVHNHLYTVIERKNEVLVLQYNTAAQFSNQTLRQLFPSADLLLIAVVVLEIPCLLVVISFLFGKYLGKRMEKLLVAARKIEEQDLDFTAGKIKIAEIDRVLDAFDQMKLVLKQSLTK